MCPTIPVQQEYQYQDRNLTSCVFLEGGHFSRAAFHIAFFLSSYLIPLVLISGKCLHKYNRWSFPFSISNQSKKLFSTVCSISILFAGLYVWMLTRLWHSGVGGHRVSAESKKGKKRVTRLVNLI
jgi:allatostatin A receptor